MLGLLTKNELIIALNRLKMSYTREQDNKADLLMVLSKNLEQSKTDFKEFVGQFSY